MAQLRREQEEREHQEMLMADLKAGVQDLSLPASLDAPATTVRRRVLSKNSVGRKH